MAIELITPQVVVQATNVDSPDFRSAEFHRQREDWLKADDILGGTPRIREKKDKYMPQFEDEDDEDYKLRVDSVYLYSGFTDTVDGLTGMVFAKDPQLGEDVAKEIVEHWEDIDGNGTHGDLFIKAAFSNSLAKGFSLLMVDFPSVDPSTMDLGQFRRLGLRPYWLRFDAQQVINFRTQRRGSRLYVTLLVIIETVQEPRGEYGYTDVVQWRVYQHAFGKTPKEDVISWKIMRQDDTDKSFRVHKSGVYSGVDEIPWSVTYTGRVEGVFECKSPIAQILYMIIAVLGLESDHMHGLHKSAIPIFVTIGRPYDPNKAEEKLRLGYNTAIEIPDPAGKAFYVESEGKALGQVADKIEKIKAEIARVGLSMLEKSTTQVESFESKRLDRAQQDSRIATAVRSHGDAIERCLRFHAMFMGLKPEQGGSITLNRDFESLALDPALIDKYILLVETGRLSLRTFFNILIAGKALPRGFNWEDEKKQIETENGGALPVIGKPLQVPEDDNQDPNKEPIIVQ